MVEEIISIGFEIVSVNRPPAIGDGHAELMLFVAFAAKRNEPAIVRGAELEQGTGDGNQRRRLIIVAVKGAEGPVDPRNAHGSSEGGANGALRKSAREVGGAQAGGKSQP